MYLLVSFQRKSRKFEKSLSLTQAVLVFDTIKTADYSEKKIVVRSYINKIKRCTV